MNLKNLLETLENNPDWEARKKALKNLGEIKQEKVIEYLILALKDLDEDVLKSAILTLGNFKDFKILPQLLKPKILKHQNPDVRWAAYFTLQKITTCPHIRLIEEFLDGSKDPVWIVRNMAVFGLKKQIDLLKEGQNQELKILLRILSTSNEEIRQMIIDKISASSKIEIKTVIENLFSLSENVKIGAIQILGELKKKEASPHLISLLYTDNNFVRKEIIKSLGKIKDEEALYPLIEKLKDKNLKLRDEASKALSNFESKAVSPLIFAFKHALDKNQRYFIIKTLGLIKDSRSISILIQALGDTHYIVRKEASRALINLKSKEVMNNLIEVLKDSSFHINDLIKESKFSRFLKVRKSAILTLGELKDYRAAKVLKEIQLEKDIQIAESAALALSKIGLSNWQKKEAIFILGEIGSPEVLTYLIKMLDHPHPDIQLEAVIALRKIHHLKSISALLRKIESKDILIRQETIKTLGILKLKKDKIFKPIINKLKDSEIQVRAQAARTLGKLKIKEAIPYLKNSLGDPSFSVQEEARLALDNF